MTPNEYMEFVSSGVRLKKDTLRERLLLAGLGIGGESGEVVDLLKKIGFHGNTVWGHELTSEIGDVLWYLFLLMDTVGITFEDVARANVEKLTTRYPETYAKWMKKRRDLDETTV